MVFMDTLLATDTLLSPTKKRRFFSRLPPKRADDYVMSILFDRDGADEVGREFKPAKVEREFLRKAVESY